MPQSLMKNYGHFYSIILDQKNDGAQERADQIVDLVDQLGDIILESLHALTLRSGNAANISLGMNAMPEDRTQIIFVINQEQVTVDDPNDQMLIHSTIQGLKVAVQKIIENLLLLKRIVIVSISVPKKEEPVTFPLTNLSLIEEA